MLKKVADTCAAKRFFMTLFTLLMMGLVSCHSSSDIAELSEATTKQAESNSGSASPAKILTEIEEISNRMKGNTDKVLVVAHRACWRLAPENSLMSIEECIRMGVDMVEIDVRKTRDGHLILMHDKEIDRTTNGSGLVNELTLDEINSFYLKEGQGGNNAALSKHKVPTLAEALAVAKGKVLVNLDVKADVRDASYFSAQALGVEKQTLIKMSLTSPEDTNLQETAFFGNTLFMPILREQNGNLAQQISSFEVIGPIAYEIIYQTEQQLSDGCKEVASQQARCWVNTLWESLAPGHSDDVAVLDPDAHWGHLLGLGVNMFQTDRPAALIVYLESKGLR